MVVLFILVKYILLHTIHNGVICILYNFQDTLRASNHTLHNNASGFMFLLHIFAILYGLFFLALLSGGGAALHFSPPLGFNLGFFTLVGELQLDQMSFDPLPSLPRNPLLELHRESSPGS